MGFMAMTPYVREKETSVTALFVPWEYIPFVSCLVDIMSNLNKEERKIRSDEKITIDLTWIANPSRLHHALPSRERGPWLSGMRSDAADRPSRPPLRRNYTATAVDTQGVRPSQAFGGLLRPLRGT